MATWHIKIRFRWTEMIHSYLMGVSYQSWWAEVSRQPCSISPVIGSIKDLAFQADGKRLNWGRSSWGSCSLGWGAAAGACVKGHSHSSSRCEAELTLMMLTGEFCNVRGRENSSARCSLLQCWGYCRKKGGCCMSDNVQFACIISPAVVCTKHKSRTLNQL